MWATNFQNLRLVPGDRTGQRQPYGRLAYGNPRRLLRHSPPGTRTVLGPTVLGPPTSLDSLDQTKVHQLSKTSYRASRLDRCDDRHEMVESQPNCRLSGTPTAQPVFSRPGHRLHRVTPRRHRANGIIRALT
jgi:hypothetical protein